MLRQMFRQFTSSISQQSVPIRSYQSQYAPKAALNQFYGVHSVKVTGKISQIFKNPNGSYNIYIRSCWSNIQNFSHKICVSQSSKIQQIVEEKLAVDQTIYVDGVLQSRRFETQDGKHRTTTQILAFKIHIFGDIAVANSAESESSNLITDLNTIELIGTASTTAAGDTFRAFTLCTPKTKNVSPRSNPEAYNFDRIFVYDENVFPILENIKRYTDQFYVRGEICYKKETNIYGKNTPSAYIKAKTIHRL